MLLLSCLGLASFSVIFSDRFSAVARSGFQSLLLTAAVNFSVCADRFANASLKRFSASSSESTISKASSGHDSTHFGSPSQRLHAMAFPVSAVDSDSSVLAGLNTPVAAFAFTFVDY